MAWRPLFKQAQADAFVVVLGLCAFLTGTTAAQEGLALKPPFKQS
jgi:Na+-translocating ferredoxin:NAD+ oxidoreductase RnfE subunit